METPRRRGHSEGERPGMAESRIGRRPKPQPAPSPGAPSRYEPLDVPAWVPFWLGTLLRFLRCRRLGGHHDRLSARDASAEQGTDQGASAGAASRDLRRCASCRPMKRQGPRIERRAARPSRSTRPCATRRSKAGGRRSGSRPSCSACSLAATPVFAAVDPAASRTSPSGNIRAPRCRPKSGSSMLRDGRRR